MGRKEKEKKKLLWSHRFHIWLARENVNDGGSPGRKLSLTYRQDLHIACDYQRHWQKDCQQSGQQYLHFEPIIFAIVAAAPRRLLLLHVEAPEPANRHHESIVKQQQHHVDGQYCEQNDNPATAEENGDLRGELI